MDGQAILAVVACLLALLVVGLGWQAHVATRRADELRQRLVEEGIKSSGYHANLIAADRTIERLRAGTRLLQRNNDKLAGSLQERGRELASLSERNGELRKQADNLKNRLVASEAIRRVAQGESAMKVARELMGEAPELPRPDSLLSVIALGEGDYLDYAKHRNSTYRALVGDPSAAQAISIVEDPACPPDEVRVVNLGRVERNDAPSSEYLGLRNPHGSAVSGFSLDDLMKGAKEL